MRDLAWINGTISELNEAKVPFLDHGYFFGYGVYEALKVYEGKPYAVEEHMDRLERSMKEVRIQPDFTRNELISIMNDLVAKSGWKDAVVYLHVTRGVGPRTHSALKNPKPTLALFVSYLSPVPDNIRAQGVKAITLSDDRWAHPYIKTLNLLPNVLAKQTAEENGAYEAILVNQDGRITEAASSNVFAVFGETLVTPPTDGKILSGITRLLVLRLAEKNGIKYREDYITLDELRKADEVFVTNTGVEVLGVTNLDGEKIGKGIPGPITNRLYELFMKDVEEFLRNSKD